MTVKEKVNDNMGCLKITGLRETVYISLKTCDFCSCLPGCTKFHRSYFLTSQFLLRENGNAMFELNLLQEATGSGHPPARSLMLQLLEVTEGGRGVTAVTTGDFLPHSTDIFFVLFFFSQLLLIYFILFYFIYLFIYFCATTCKPKTSSLQSLCEGELQTGFLQGRK